MSITDTDLMTLASLSELDARRPRDLPAGIGRGALRRLDRFQLAKGTADSGYLRTANGTGVLRNHTGRLEILTLMGKLNDAQLAEISAILARRR
ncbi:hypothetical protein [Azospirillum sp. sgz302134]